MGLVPARCTQCGANITIDETKEAGICQVCGTAFITEKAVKNYITNNNNITNVQHQTNIYLGENLFEKEKRECKLLLMLLNKMDLQYLKEQALKVLSVNPDNTLATTIYDCDFRTVYYDEYLFLEFEEQPLYAYLKKECGNIDTETSITFIKALLCEVGNDTNVAEGVNLIFDNLSQQNLTKSEIFSTYKGIARMIGDVERINTILYTSKLAKTVGILSLFDSTASASESFETARAKKQVALSMLESRKIIGSAFQGIVNKTSLSATQKQEILAEIAPVFGGKAPVQAGGDAGQTQQTQQAPQTQHAPQAQQTSSVSRKIGGIFLICIGIAFLVVCLTSLEWFALLLYGGLATLCIALGINIIQGKKNTETEDDLQDNVLTERAKEEAKKLLNELNIETLTAENIGEVQKTIEERALEVTNVQEDSETVDEELLESYNLLLAVLAGNENDMRYLNKLLLDR